MARVNIEERAAAGAKKLARAMKWSKSDALGRLYYLWHDSQELEQTHCTVDDLAIWMELDSDEEPLIVGALINAGFVEHADDGRHLICGNEKHIENLKQRRDSASIGGKRSAETRRASPQIEAHAQAHAQANASTETQASDVASALLCSSLQFSAKNENNIYSRAQAPEGPEIGATVPPTVPLRTKPAEQERCEKDFIETCEYLGIPRPTGCSYQEKVAIAEAIKRHGFLETRYALTGMRWEAKTQTYDPSLHCTIHRAFESHLIGKFQNIARKKMAEQKKNANSPRRLETSTASSGPPVDEGPDFNPNALGTILRSVAGVAS